MEVGTFQSIAKAIPENAGVAAQPGQGLFSLSAEGGLGFFDLILQNLLASPTEAGAFTLNQQGGGSPLLSFSADAAVFPSLESGFENKLLLNLEDLAGFLEQFTANVLSDSSVPAIFQELQAAFDQAVALGQTEVDLGAILNQATPQEGIDLLNFFEGTGPQGLTQMQSDLRSVLEGFVSTESGTSVAGTAKPQTSLGDLLKAFTAQANAAPDVKPEANPVVTAQNLLEKIFGKALTPAPEVTGNSPRPTVQFEDPQAFLNSLIQKSPFANIVPDYLNQELLQQQGLQSQVQPLVQTVTSKDANPVGLGTVIPENVQRTSEALLDALSLGDANTRSHQNDSGMRQSLNLTDQGDGFEQSLHQDGEAEHVKTSEAIQQFEDNLKRLQDAQAVIKQITRNVHLNRGIETQDISVKLQPEYLGNLSLRVSMQEGNVASIHILTERGQVRDLLESNVQALRSSLENSDMKVKDITIDLSPDSEDFLASESKLSQESAGDKSADGGDFPGFSLNGNGLPSDSNGSNSSRASLADQLFRVNFLA